MHLERQELDSLEHARDLTAQKSMASVQIFGGMGRPVVYSDRIHVSFIYLFLTTFGCFFSTVNVGEQCVLNMVFFGWRAPQTSCILAVWIKDALCSCNFELEHPPSQ